MYIILLFFIYRSDHCEAHMGRLPGEPSCDHRLHSRRHRRVRRLRRHPAAPRRHLPGPGGLLVSRGLLAPLEMITPLRPSDVSSTSSRPWPTKLRCAAPSLPSFPSSFPLSRGRYSELELDALARDRVQHLPLQREGRADVYGHDVDDVERGGTLPGKQSRSVASQR